MEENGNIDMHSDGHVQFDNSENYLDLEPLEDLDDAEFGLPPVDQPPSLEDILAADIKIIRYNSWHWILLHTDTFCMISFRT